MVYTEGASIANFVCPVVLIAFCGLLLLIHAPIAIWFYTEGKKYFKMLSYFANKPQLSVYDLHMDPHTKEQKIALNERNPLDALADEVVTPTGDVPSHKPYAGIVYNPSSEPTYDVNAQWTEEEKLEKETRGRITSVNQRRSNIPMETGWVDS